MYTYHYHLVFLPIERNEEGNDINKEVFKNTPHFVKNILRVNCIHNFYVQ